MGAFFIIEAICALMTPGYSYLVHDISFLGFTACLDAYDGLGGIVTLCPELAWLINLALAIAGVAQVAGLATTFTMWPVGRLGQLGLVLLGIGGVLVFMVGIFPFNVQPRIHTWSASLHFLFAGLGMGALGLSLGLRSRAGAFAFVMAAISLAGLVGYTFYFGPLRGLVERAAAYPIIIWFAVTGVGMLRAAAKLR